MIEILLKILLVIIGVSILQIAFNTWVLNQSGVMRWISFAGLSIAVILSGAYLYIQVDKVVDIPYLGVVIKGIDVIIAQYFDYLPNSVMFLWFLVPLIVAWIYFLVKSLFEASLQRIQYFQWKKKQELKEQKEVEKQVKSKSTEENVEVESIEPTVEIKEAIVTEDAGEEIEEENSEFDDVHFLSEPVGNIRYNSLLGLQKSYDKAKRKGLQLAETATGYVAVYADKQGVNELKKLMTQNSVDYKELKNRPSIVFFDKEKASCLPIKEALQKMNEGESIE